MGTELLEPLTLTYLMPGIQFRAPVMKDAFPYITMSINTIGYESPGPRMGAREAGPDSWDFTPFPAIVAICRPLTEGRRMAPGRNLPAIHTQTFAIKANVRVFSRIALCFVGFRFASHYFRRRFIMNIRRFAHRYIATSACVASILVTANACIVKAQNASAPASVNYPVIPNGARFLIGMSQEIGTAKNKVNDRFVARTLEPLSADNGLVLPPGAEIRGHISRIEAAGATGHARIWLTFEDIKTHDGRLPMVATVVSVPGDFSVKQEESKEGEIETRSSKAQRDAEAAATGAAAGGIAGAKAGGTKGAAVGALAGAAAGFLASSSLGQEIDLPKGTKVEIELLRPVYLAAH